MWGVVASASGVASNLNKMDLKKTEQSEIRQYTTTGTIVYNKIVAQGVSERGDWKRSIVVVEYELRNGNLDVKTMVVWGECPMKVGDKGTFTWQNERHQYTDKSGVQRTQYTCRMVDYAEEGKPKDLFGDENNLF